MKNIVVLLAVMHGSSLWAACDFPDSERAEAPAWLCGEPRFEDASFLAVGDKSRMPSVSLQNRFAGRMGIEQVLSKLFLAAHDTLQEELPVAVKLEIPDNSDPVVARRFMGIRVFDKAKSPQRHLYVLVGVPESERAALMARARQDIVSLNRDRLLAALGPAGYKAFADKVMASPPE